MDFTLRKWRIEDIASVAHYANNEKIARNLRDAFPYPYTEQDAKSYIETWINNGDDNGICRAIEIDGNAVGSIGVFPCSDVYRRTAELGYWLAEEYWGKGIMTAAAKQICAEAFEKLDIVRIYAEAFAHNGGSRRVLEKSGFILEGIRKCAVFKNGKIYDDCMYALLKNSEMCV